MKDSDKIIRLDFEHHWGKNTLSQISPQKLIQARIFLQPVCEQIRQAQKPVHILDIGCGDGVHSTVLQTNSPEKHQYYGIDLSLEAIQLIQHRNITTNNQKATFQVGNALALPYHSDSFDIVFSYGVIAYTGASEDVLDEIVRVSKPGALIGLWLYPKMSGLAGMLFKLARSITQLLGEKRSRFVVYIVVLLLPILPVRSGINLFNSTWQQCIEVVEVNLLPDVLDFYTLEDVLEWFDNRNIEIQHVDPERLITVWGRV